MRTSSGHTWYKVVGEGSGLPLITVHGGPGYPHDYLETLQFLACDRPVLFYDQRGCGHSDPLPDPEHWNLAHFIAELADLREELAWSEVHLFGHSWGTLISLEHMLAGNNGVVSATLASPAISIPRWSADMWRLCAQMPDGFQQTVERHLHEGTTDDEEYQACCDLFSRHHLCRLYPWPECMQRSFEKCASELYEAMWGPSEFHPVGTLRDYDRTARLRSLAMPVLYTCGRYDEAAPETCDWYRSLTPCARLMVFEESSHMPHLEQPDQYLAVLGSFLAEAERRWIENRGGL